MKAGRRKKKVSENFMAVLLLLLCLIIQKNSRRDAVVFIADFLWAKSQNTTCVSSGAGGDLGA